MVSASTSVAVGHEAHRVNVKVKKGGLKEVADSTLLLSRVYI